MQRPTVLLDEQLFGLDEFLRDLGWTTAKVRVKMTDDEVVEFAKGGKYIVVSEDQKLLKRCRVMGIPMIDLGIEAKAKPVHESLQKMLSVQTRPLTNRERTRGDIMIERSAGT